MHFTTQPPAAGETAGPTTAAQDALFLDALARFGPDLARFVGGYERQEARRQELLQEVHLSLWQSLATFQGQCSLRTWAYRVAHNVGATHVHRETRSAERHYLDLDEVSELPGEDTAISGAQARLDIARILSLIHRLGPPDREVMLLYLEDMDAASIGDITGLSARNVATKVHRIKKLLAARFNATTQPQEAS